MTTRRRPDFLAKTIRSLQLQTISDFELVISDNDPDGSARGVVEKFNDPRIDYACNGADLGMNASFNRSLQRARGEFIVMITDDDPIYPDMLEVLKGLAEQYPGLGAYYGGCDVLQQNPRIAKMTLHRVGRNSCLAPLPLNAIRTFTSESYPHAFFGGELQMYTLWSVGMVRREIALEVGGLPEYGSPYLGDFYYIVSACSHSGCAVINVALGCQTIHDFNFGRKECTQMKTAALGFFQSVEKRFGSRSDWRELREKVERYLGQWLILHSLFLKQYFREFDLPRHDLRAALRDIFEVPFVKRMRRFYLVGGAFLTLQRIQLELRNQGFRRMQRRS